ncbi:MAG: hypothetical protein LRZ84_06445 [Desertifilum sp.]|nr:hypothetical protein [Desertifilum sp.]MDI9641025.1 hypothetical protein [Geitlerinema splendidum]
MSLTKKITTDLNLAQLKNFQRWRRLNESQFSLWDYLHRVSRVEVALAYTKLFLPDFIEYEGGIFLKEAFSQDFYEQWKVTLDGDMTAIEKVMNHQHIDDLLPGAEQVGIDNLLYLGEAIAQTWDSRLRSVYPDKPFNVECQEDDCTVVVTFSQIR